MENPRREVHDEQVTWLVVADGGRARVFQMPGLTLDLQEKEDLVNDEYSGTVLTEKDREKFAKRVPTIWNRADCISYTIA